jgi:hypothetical protein
MSLKNASSSMIRTGKRWVDDAHRRAVSKQFTKDEARRGAANFAKLPELKRLSSGQL